MPSFLHRVADPIIVVSLISAKCPRSLLEPAAEPPLTNHSAKPSPVSHKLKFFNTIDVFP